MFSGIIEAVSPCVSAKASSNNLQLTLKRPKSFKSLQEGASIAVDGICLTLESFNSQKMVFSLGPETLSITGWNAKNCKNKELNLERSLSLQSALGGHIM
ncbi:MAG: riboflavin synthase, partial [Bdellovibrionales bacterium]